MDPDIFKYSFVYKFLCLCMLLATMVTFSLATLNVAGIRGDDKRAKVFEYLRSLKHDFYLLQETHVQTEDVEKWSTEWGGPCFWNPGGKISRGVAIICNVSLDFEDLDVKRDLEGRILNLKLSMNDWVCQIMCVYAPNDPRGRSEFFSNLWRHTFPEIPLFLGGDFNCIDNLQIDKVGGDPLAGDRGSKELNDFIDSLSIKDVFRVKFPDKRRFSRHNKSNTNLSRIDRIYAPDNMIHGAFGCNFDPCAFSDHDLVSVKFKCKQTLNRGPGLWKFNCSLISDDNYTRLMSQFLQDWRTQKERYPDLRTWWDIGKVHIRDITVDFATSKRGTKRYERNNLVKQLNSAVQELSPNADFITGLRQQIRDIDEELISGVIVRSKELWVEQGEKPTKYFFNLEKKRQQKKDMTELNSHAGTLLKESKDIRQEMNLFYKELFSEEDVDLDAQNWLLDQLSMSLDEEEQTSCEGLLTAEECRKALNGMDTGKSPGIDGLTTEFYLAFWAVLGNDLVEVLNYGFQHGQLSVSQRRGLLSLIFKKGEKKDLKNWRPISLLCVDYKIGTKALAARLQKVLPTVLHEDQTCGVPGRSIFSNLNLIRDLIEYCNSKGLPLAIISLDQEKAFDRVNWNFLDRVLQKMNFGPEFRQWIRIIYTDISSACLHSGFVTSFFEISRGARQGDPLSSLLYTLVAEVLGAAIRNCKEIRGVRLPGTSEESKISQYADDGNLTLVDVFSIAKAFEIVHVFEKGSGSKLNLDKTEGMWFGSKAGLKDGPVNIKWRTDCIKVLGIYFTMSPQDFETLNWNFRIEKLAKKLDAWKFRTLSLKGKSMIINSLGLSGLWYTGSVVPLPAWAEKRINRIIFNFLWSGKNEQIKREVCYLPYELGGLKVVNVALKCKALLAKSVVFITDEQYRAKWVYLARYFIGRALGKVHTAWGFLKSNIKPHAWSAPGYYQSVASAAKDIKDVFITFVGKTLAVKVIYAELLVVSRVRVRSRNLWQGKLDRAIPWSKIYLHSYKGFSTNQEHDVFFKVMHYVLKTGEYFSSWNSLHFSLDCSFCPGQLETAEHLFLNCYFAKEVWNWATPLFRKLLNDPDFVPSLRSLIGLDFVESFPMSSQKLAYYFLKLILYAIWHFRNRKRFGKSVCTAQNAISLIEFGFKQTCSKKFEFFRQKLKLSKFKKQWCIGEAFCKVDRLDRLVFLFS